MQERAAPAKANRNTPPFANGTKDGAPGKKSKAISWFKDSAHEHTARVRSLVAILRHHEVAVRMLRADRVGYVVYEDEYQIVAEPFAEHK